jgi:hypothetical protein
LFVQLPGEFRGLSPPPTERERTVIPSCAPPLRAAPC